MQFIIVDLPALETPMKGIYIFLSFNINCSIIIKFDFIIFIILNSSSSFTYLVNFPKISFNIFRAFASLFSKVFPAKGAISKFVELSLKLLK